MSSWIIAKSRQTKKKPSVTKYHDTASSPDVFEMYMSFIGSYIYSQKMGETCNVWDDNGLLKSTLKANPQVKYLQEKPTEATVLVNKDYVGFTSQIKFKEIQKLAGTIISYEQALNQTVVRVVEKAGIRAMFDIGIHLERDPAGPNLAELKKYAASIKAYQTKAKKDTLSVYIMSDNYSTVSHFQTYCDPSWKITALCKTPPKDTNDAFVQAMAEVQIMTAVPALILDFERTVDRFIYLMQRNQRLNYFVEMGDKEWALL
jgi:hypothetical protein